MFWGYYKKYNVNSVPLPDDHNDDIAAPSVVPVPQRLEGSFCEFWLAHINVTSAVSRPIVH